MIELTADQIEAIARAEYARIGGDDYRPTRKRSTPKPCPRGNDPEGDLRCSGVTVEGVTLVEPHEAPATEFGHHGRDCRKGKSRCRDYRCRRCMGVSNNVRAALRRARRDGMTDAEIRRATPQKRCPSCATVKPSSEFYVARANADGLDSKCSPCAYEISKRTTLPETRRAKDRRRRAAIAGAENDDFTEADLYQKHYDADVYGCWLCDIPFGTPGVKFNVEHTWPIALGGSNTLDNVWWVCEECHYHSDAGAKAWKEPWSWTAAYFRATGNDVAAELVEAAAAVLPIDEWVAEGRARVEAAIAEYERVRGERVAIEEIAA